MKYAFEDCFGSRVRSLSRKIDGIYRKHLGDAGITENQLSIMMALYKTGRIEQNVIGGFLNLEKSSLSRNLVRLIKMNLIKKDGPVNRPLIGLTEPGRHEVERLTPRWEAAMDEISAVLDMEGVKGFGTFEKQLSKL